MTGLTVFLSSVRRGLEQERDHLPALIRALGHLPSRFEDFTAADVPSREACLAGVENADVYVLLLGEHYGTRMIDTGRAPTEEEFTVARRRGIPVLVFHKHGIDPDPEQDQFIGAVGDYANGRFWKEFASSSDLDVALVEALRQVAAQPAALTWTPLATPATVPWRGPDPQASRGYLSTAAPVLELHLVNPPGSVAPLRTSQIAVLGERLASTGRQHGLFSQAHALEINYDTEQAWATVRAGQDQRRSAWHAPAKDPTSGISVTRRGDVLVFESLATDMLGTLVDQAFLTARLTALLTVAADASPLGQQEVVPAAGISGGTQIAEGDPATLGRNGGTMPPRQEHPLRTAADNTIPMSALPAAAEDVARDLAVELITTLRQHPRP